MRLKLCTIVFLLSIASSTLAQGVGQLPMGLEYFMSANEVESQLSAMSDYEIQDGKASTLSYMVPARDTETTNGLFLKFGEKGLVEIASMKMDMKRQLYNRYMDQLVGRAAEWKEAGVEIVWEDDTNAIYIYRDEQSQISISGSEVKGQKERYSVTLTFTENQFSLRSE